MQCKGFDVASKAKTVDMGLRDYRNLLAQMSEGQQGRKVAPGLGPGEDTALWTKLDVP